MWWTGHRRQLWKLIYIQNKKLSVSELYGIAEYFKTEGPSHYMFLRREQHDRINPSSIDDYSLKEIRFVFSQDINLK